MDIRILYLGRYAGTLEDQKALALNTTYTVANCPLDYTRRVEYEGGNSVIPIGGWLIFEEDVGENVNFLSNKTIERKFFFLQIGASS